MLEDDRAYGVRDSFEGCFLSLSLAYAPEQK